MSILSFEEDFVCPKCKNKVMSGKGRTQFQCETKSCNVENFWIFDEGFHA